MGLKLANNAITRLAAGIAAGDLSLSVTPGTGALFPTLGVGDYFPATLVRGSDGAIEIVKVTARATDVFTIERAKENTTALAFIAGDRIELRLTAQTIEDNFMAVEVATHAATSKTTPVDADELPLVDSAAGNVLKKLTWANVKATLKTYFDTLYRAITDDVTLAAGKVVIFEGSTDDGFETTLTAADPTADRTLTLPDSTGTLALETKDISATAPATGDYVSFSDVSDSNKEKKATIADILALAGSSGAPTGTVFDYVGTSAPSGYVFLSGRTIGSASSGATERANADTETLFTLLWNSMSNTEAPVSGGRGASAAADFAANKTITLPDARGRVVAGKDNMGGSTASRLTSGGSGVVGTTLGAVGGAETHTLITAQMPSHSHSHSHTIYGLNDSASGPYPVLQGSNSAGASYSTTSDATAAGSGNAHQNTQPTLVLNKIIKL